MGGGLAGSNGCSSQKQSFSCLWSVWEEQVEEGLRKNARTQRPAKSTPPLGCILCPRLHLKLGALLPGPRLCSIGRGCGEGGWPSGLSWRRLLPGSFVKSLQSQTELRPVPRPRSGMLRRASASAAAGAGWGRSSAKRTGSGGRRRPRPCSPCRTARSRPACRCC